MQRVFDIELKLLLEGIYQCYQQDFRSYSVASLRRRLRLAMQRLNCQTLSQLQDQVLHDPAVFARMMDFLTVQVSEMFRDPSYYRGLREQVLPVLKTYPSIKIWVAGCSRGEEVWSLAIMLHEEGLLERSLIYATDINPHALQAAEAGIYELDRVADYSRNYLEAGGSASLSDYYTAAYGSVRFNPDLKRHVVFADHSLATDTVFSETHLVSCRNVLIYFNRALQQRALDLFRNSLVRRGYLGLGSRESLRYSDVANDFQEVVPGERIYRLL
jgi:chemotaxis protein methyltransferase CheR